MFLRSPSRHRDASDGGAKIRHERALYCPALPSSGRYLSYHEYEGLALDAAERESLQKHHGKNDAMLLRNHGALVCGPSVAAAFATGDNIETACRSQIMAMQTGAKIRLPTKQAQEHTANQYERIVGGRADTVGWPAMLSWLEELGVQYAE